jgi:16S rRNA (adenine1518-N6/adenine1519-N6)-dimethyltransferase
MDLTNKKDLAVLLKMHGMRLDKNLGQHYLIDQKVLRVIVESGNIQLDDQIVEVGPGAGVLTVELGELSDYVTTIELDSRVIPVLRSALGLESQVQILNADALDYELPSGNWKWIANLPYQITSPILRKYLFSEKRPQISVLLIQREVADKICEEKGNRIGLLVRNFCEVEKLINVPPTSFFPPPKVDSAVIKLVARKEPIISAEDWLVAEKVMKVAFLQKRKKIKKSLSSLYPDALEKLEKVGIDPDRRPETLSLEEWDRLSRELDLPTSTAKQKKAWKLKQS